MYYILAQAPNTTPLLEYGVLGIVLSLCIAAIVKLYSDKQKLLKEKDKQVKIVTEEKDTRIAELNNWIRKTAESNIEALKEVSNLVDKVMDVAKNSEINLTNKVEDEAASVKTHVSLEIEKLKNNP